jgi:hypothetical protein
MTKHQGHDSTVSPVGLLTLLPFGAGMEHLPENKIPKLERTL